jgi:RNA polymerase sigma factor (sigma-70 family)
MPGPWGQKRRSIARMTDCSRAAAQSSYRGQSPTDTSTLVTDTIDCLTTERGIDAKPRSLMRVPERLLLAAVGVIDIDTSSQERVLVENEDFDNRRKALSEALTVLNDRELRIFKARRLIDEPISLEDLAEKFGVSRERVRQIEVRAFEKVQKAVRHRVAAMERPEALAAP